MMRLFGTIDDTIDHADAILTYPFTIVSAPPAGYMPLRWYDFEVPAWGEFWGVPVASGTGSIAQSAAAAHPDRPAADGVGVAVTLASGSGSAYLIHDMLGDEQTLNLRFAFDPNTLSGGEVTLLRAVDLTAAEVITITFDPSTSTVTADVGGAGGSLTATVSSGIDWHAIELSIDLGSGNVALWIDGVQRDTDTGATAQARLITFGCASKATAAEGVYYLDEFRVDASYIGPVTIEPTLSTAADPARWLVVYNTADADSIAWAETYRAARGVPYANLCGLALSTDEAVNTATYEAMRDAIASYIATNMPAGQIAGILLGHGCPGVLTGTPNRSIASCLADLTDDTEASNTRYMSGVPGTDDLPARSTMLSGDYLVAEIQAADVDDAEALATRAAALVGSRGLSTLDPDDDRLGISVATWAALTAWQADVEGDQVRLPAAAGYDGSSHGHAIEITDATGGAFDVAGQTKAMLITSGDDTAEVMRSAGDLVADAIAAGYAVAVGFTDAPSAGQLLNPAALFAAFRGGWTLAEAVALAAPKINSVLRVIGDPLAVVPMPLQGYNVYSRAFAGQPSTLVAVWPAGAGPHTLTGFAANSEQDVMAKAVSRCGVEDVEPSRWKHVAFDGDGDFIAPAPNRPVSVTLSQVQGVVTAKWNYITNGQAIAPATFVVYVSVDGGAYVAQAPKTFSSQRIFSQAIGTYTHGQRLDVKVVAKSAAGTASAYSAIASIVVDTVAPDPAASIAVEVTT